MHASIVLLDRAIGLAEQELELLEEDDSPDLERSAVNRLELVDLAWRERSGCDMELLQERLVSLQEVQDRLSMRAKELYAEVHNILKDRRKHGGQLARYGKKLAHVRNPLSINKVS